MSGDQFTANEKGPKRRKDSGFNLLELMIALAVLAIALIGMAQLLAIAIQQNSFSRYNSVGVELARGKLEELKATYNLEMTSGQSASDMSVGSHGPEVVVLDGSRAFALTWNVTDLGGGQRGVSVAVRPNGVSNPEASIPTRGKTITMTGVLTP